MLRPLGKLSPNALLARRLRCCCAAAGAMAGVGGASLAAQQQQQPAAPAAVTTKPRGGIYAYSIHMILIVHYNKSRNLE